MTVKRLIEVNPESLLEKIIEHYVTFNCTWLEILNIVKIINDLIGCIVVPNTKYLLMKIFTEDSNAFLYFECHSCKKYGFVCHVKDRIISICSNCQSESVNRKSAFVYFPLKTQLQKVLDQNINQLNIHTEVPEPFPMTDFYNSEIYRTAIRNEGPVIALGYNSDGVKR